MVFTADERSQFKIHGYIAKPHFFSERETTALQMEIAMLMDLGALRNVATDGDGKTHSTKLRNLQLCPMYNHSTMFRALPFHPSVVSAISELIGDPFILHLDQVFLKPGGDGMGTNWHQDNAYFKISDPLKGTAMWVAVHDATVANGTIRVVPESYKIAYEHSRDPYSDHHIRCYPPEERAETIELEAGGALFFCYGTAHCTGQNKTEKERAGIAFHFLHTDYAQKDLIEDGRDYRPYVTGPHATGGKAEYGIHVESAWEDEVEKALAG
ncbi:MAG: phytanoyl-CoA dioxygenase family protein [Gemmatimonadota bacterium]|nr:phytanoyl-CoA dioxygenase family protein [Gemmatimonadota bacterium]